MPRTGTGQHGLPADTTTCSEHDDPHATPSVRFPDSIGLLYRPVVPDVPPLALLLLQASRWFDRQVLLELEAAGWPRLTPAQSLLFAEMDPAGISPAALSRRLGTTRQSAHDLVAGLVRLDLLSVEDDPARRGGRLVMLTSAGHALARDARQILAGLEGRLDDAGTQRLRTALGELWPSPREP